jgi:flagellar hook-associated protein 2
MGGINRTTFSGLASGLDTKLLISSLLSIQRRPLNLLESRKDELSKQQSLYRELNTSLLSLRDAARDIDNLNSTLSDTSINEEFLKFKTTTTDEDIITATGTGDANPGNYDVQVTTLALQPRELSLQFADSSSVIAAEGETLSFDFGASDSRNFTITAGTGGSSLQEIRDLINQNSTNDNDILAEILFDGSSYRLMISGVEFGAANDFSYSGDLASSAFIDSGSGIGQEGIDAAITVLGISVTSESNTIVDALPGVTLELHGKSTGTESIGISLDSDKMKEGLQTFVDAFNKVSKFINTQFKVDSATHRSGPLSNDSLLRNLQGKLQTLITNQFSFTGNSYTSLNDIGVELEAGGTLSIDSDRFEAALATSPISVKELLSGDGSTNGAMADIASELKYIVQFGDGLLAERDKSLNKQINGIKDQIERFEARLLVREETLLQRFGRMEAAISSLRSAETFFAGFRR